MLKSLATTKNDYRPVQVRILKDDILNIQAKGAEVNREYGAANKVEDEDIATYLEKRHALVPSLADTEQVYVPAQAAIRGSKVHLQFESVPFNRTYGAAFDLDADDVPAIATLLGWSPAPSEDVTEEEEEPAAFTGCGH